MTHHLYKVQQKVKECEKFMGKNLVYWMVSIVFFVIYFLIFKYSIGNLFPISPMSNFIIIFVLTVINIPLSVFSTEKIFSIIENQ